MSNQQQYFKQMCTRDLESFILLVYAIKHNICGIESYVLEDEGVLRECDQSKLSSFIEMVRSDYAKLVDNAMTLATVAVQDKVSIVVKIDQLIDQKRIEENDKLENNEVKMYEELICQLLSLAMCGDTYGDTYNVAHDTLHPMIYLLLIKHKMYNSLSLNWSDNKSKVVNIIDYYINNTHIEKAVDLLRKFVDYYTTNTTGAEDVLKKLVDYYTNNPAVEGGREALKTLEGLNVTNKEIPISTNILYPKCEESHLSHGLERE